MHWLDSNLVILASGPIGAFVLFVVLLLALAVLAALCREAASYLAERGHASRVARLLDVLASQADGIAGVLLAHPPAPAATLAAVREAAIAQAVGYVKTNLPQTLASIGVNDGVLAARLGNYVTAALRGTALGAAAVPAVAPPPAATPAA